MNIYLAGGITGNLVKEWKNYMELHLANVISDKRVIKYFLADDNKNQLESQNQKKNIGIDLKDIYILESFFYINKQEWMHSLFKEFKGFLLDSGAFTFMNLSSSKNINWEQYVINYGNYIKLHNIKLFFELDIDSIVGIKEVERLRELLEEIAGKKCIPVWHKSRGLEYWEDMCKKYEYVAIGGIVTQEIKKNEYDIFYHLLKIARDNNCRVHGLGFTSLNGMEKYKFHSVDSTSWISGNKFGAVYLFDGKTMQVKKKTSGQRVKNKEVAIHNFKEWVKFSKYAEQNL